MRGIRPFGVPPRPCRWLVSQAVIGLTMALAPVVAGPLCAQGGEDSDDIAFINFAYSAQLGIGVYKVGDELTVSTLKIPISWSLRPRSDDTWGLVLKAPITIGRYKAREDFIGIEFVQEADAVSVIPGAELSMPLSPNWVLRTYLDAGFGWDLANDNSAVLLSAGVTSRYQGWSVGNYDLTLGNALIWASNISTGDQETIDYALLKTGLGVELPKSYDLWGRENHFRLYFMNLHFLPRIEFSRLAQFERQDSVDQFELGFSFGSDEAWKVLKLIPIRRFGLAYRLGKNFWGIRFVTGFPF